MSIDPSLSTIKTSLDTPGRSKRPTPMAFSAFGGTDPFPSCGSPYVSTNKIKLCRSLEPPKKCWRLSGWGVGYAIFPTYLTIILRGDGDHK